MNSIYWVVRYKAKGRSKAMPIAMTLRPTRTASITACMKGFDESWAHMKARVGLEVVKVQLIEPVAASYIARL